MSKIKIGQIGVGHAHADGKMRVYRQSSDFEVVGIVEPNEALRRAAQASSIYADLPWMSQEQLLNVPGLQAVAVETQVAGLLDAAEACVAAGKHVHLDKPAGASLPHYRRILDAAERQHLTVQVGYMYRYNPAVLLLFQFLERGWLGEPFELHAVMSKVIRSDQRSRLSVFPGGMMFELGCHIIDLTVAVMGAPPQIVPYIQHLGDDGLADNMLAVFEYPRALATVKSTAHEVEGFARRQLSVCGMEGTMHIQPLDAPHVTLSLDRPRGKYERGVQRIEFGDYARYVADAEDLARIIRGEKDADYSYEHDYAVQRAVLEAAGMPTDV